MASAPISPHPVSAVKLIRRTRAKPLLSAALVLALELSLASCSSFSGFVADNWPRWAGGMPPDVPPRPGAPGYEEFMARQQARRDGVKPAAPEQKADTPAAPPATADAVPGGLY